MFSYVMGVCLQVVKNRILKAFLPVLRELSLVSIHLFEETYTSLESPVHSEDYCLGPNSVN